MRKIILVLGLALSTGVLATSPNSNSNFQSQIDDLKAGLHDVHMNTLQKYSESWGLEDRGNIAKLQETKLDKTVFAVDQARQDKALADSVTNQAKVDAKQTSDLKGYADKKAESAYSTSVAHTDAKVARADADRMKGDTALSQRIDSTVAAQSDRDAGQDTHINAVQNAAQAANESAERLSNAVQETNAQVAVTDNRSINNAVRLDGVEQVNDRQDTAIASKVDTEAFKADQQRQDLIAASETSNRIAGDSYINSRVDVANANIEANHQASVANNKRLAEHTAELANHEQRIEGLEKQTNKAFADMKGRIDRVENRANAGTSAALSAAAIPQVTEYQTFALGAGVGGYEGESALAVGFSSRVSSAVVIKAAVTTDSQHGVGYNAGLSIGW